MDYSALKSAKAKQILDEAVNSYTERKYYLLTILRYS